MPSSVHPSLKKRTSAITVLVTLVIVALVVRFGPNLHTDWEDLVAIGKLDSGRGDQGIRRWVAAPGQPPLVITVLKHAGGMHNRVWELSVAVAGNGAVEPDQELAWPFMKPPHARGPEPLASICTLQSVDDFAEYMTAPSFWYRVTADGLEVLVEQADNGWNDDFGFKEGYYIWTPGDVWRSSDRWGATGPPASYDRAKTQTDPHARI